MRVVLIPAAALMLVACQPNDDGRLDTADPDTRAAAPRAPESSSVPAPAAYVGRWAADLTWCANTIGPERPIQITETQFQGYENTCEITERQAADDGWTATFVCQAEGQVSTHPVRIVANGTRLAITWIDEGYDVDWRRCPA